MQLSKVVILVAVVAISMASAGIFGKKKEQEKEPDYTSGEKCGRWSDPEKCDVCCRASKKHDCKAGIVNFKGYCYCWTSSDLIIDFNMQAPWRGQAWAEEAAQKYGYTGHLNSEDMKTEV